MSLDWGLLVAAYVAGLNTAGLVGTLISWLRTRGKERQSEVKILFKSILPALVLYDDKTTPNYEWEFLKQFKPNKELLIQTLPVLRMTNKKMATKLTELLGILDKTNYFQLDIMTTGLPETADNPKVRVLVNELRKDIEKSLTK